MAKSDCEHILNLIPLYIDNMLSEEENDILCEHIKICRECKKEAEFLKSVTRVAGEIPEIEVPNDFHERLMNKIAMEDMQKKRFGIVALKRTAISFATAAAVIALSVTAHFNLPKNTDTKDVDDFAPITISVPEQEPVIKEESKKETIKPKAKTVQAAEEPKAVPKTDEKEQETVPNEANMISVISDDSDDKDTETRIEKHQIVSVTLDDGEYEKAEEILNDFEKDDKGYKIYNNLEDIIAKLSELYGFSSQTEQSDEIECNYIVLEN